jgi:hypothetical protein
MAIKEELGIWLEQIRSQLEDSAAATVDSTPPLDYAQLRHLQGSALFCRRALGIIEVLKHKCMEIQDDDNY